ncbi:hypothetical protein AcV7_001441 [Taiwanofungus camphoratus]|nr:hypothetical protein AcV7_001441 [Antrodia cinnamomea]
MAKEARWKGGLIRRERQGHMQHRSLRGLYPCIRYGNSCHADINRLSSYANSVLQALYFCGPFRELLVQYPDPSVPDAPSPSPPAAPLPVPILTPANPTQNARRKGERKFSVSEIPPAHTYSPSMNPPTSVAIAIPPSPPTLLSALRSLFLHISKHPADKGTVAPRAFIDKLKELNELFRSSMHQDAHEFLNFLLNRIVEEMEDDRRNGLKLNGNTNGPSLSGEDLSTSIATLSSTAANPTSTASVSTTHPFSFHTTFIHRLFEGVLTSETRCLTCETVSSRDESFLDLSIDIEHNSSVTACLRQFSASEMLCQKNKFFCDSCCDLQEAEKRMKIKKLPNILALHLKRFKYQEDVGKYIKLAYRVAFPLELRLFNTVDDAENPDRLYELFGIVVHIGSGPHHGHYVTIIKARGTWLLFDDDNVDTMKESDIPKYFGDSPNGAAYVLYYQAVDLDMAALGLQTHEPAPSTSDVGSAPAKPVSVATVTDTSEHEPGSPALPPGLTEELDSSDKSDSPVPITPASQPLPLSPNQEPKVPPSPSLTAQPVPQSSPSSTTPVQASVPTGTFGGLLSTLRHTPSIRVRANGHGSENRRSVLDLVTPPVPAIPSSSTTRLSRRPATAQSVASTAEMTHQTHEFPAEPSSPSRKTSTANGFGREKTPEKKTSMWFRRKSSRLEASFAGTSSDRPLSAGKEEAGWFRTSHASSRRTSEAGLSDVPPVLRPTSPIASPSPKLSSVTSPLSNTVASVPSSPVSGHPSVPEHKKSTPDLARGKSGRSHSSMSSLAKLPKRPSTAGATVGSSPWSRPNSSVAPPLPPLPGSPQSPSNGAGFSHSGENGNGNSGLKETAGGHRAEQIPRPSSAAAYVPNPVGFSVSSSTTTTTTSTGVADGSAANKKRGTRKLSFTAPILGFGRKDRDRHKDKDMQPPPSSFTPSR